MEVYEVQDTLIAEWMGKEERSCVVIERRELLSSPGQYKYYVHWHDFNRRMDEWINAHEIVRKVTAEERNELQEKEKKEKEDDEEHPPKADAAAVAVEGPSSSPSAEVVPPTEGSLVSPATSIAAAPTARKTQLKKLTRGRKRKSQTEKVEFAEPDEHDEHEGMDAASIREHEEVTKVKNVRCVEVGKYRMATWYFSPFPKEYFPDGPIDVLYFCEFCMSFFLHKEELQYHQARMACPRHPPGNEIYRHENISVFEVDGAVSKTYGQNLCYFAKLFLDHKTLYYDVDPFLFYVICEVDKRGFHPVGYFSKEKYSELGYNLACILTFPCHQRKGYGNFIIQFSYELSKKEEKVGSPEKPLSDLGLVSYRSYWTRVLLSILKDHDSKEISVMDLTKLTSIKSEDIINTLQYLNVIKYFNGQYILVVAPETMQEMLRKVVKKGSIVNPEKLHWTPLHIDIKRDKWALKAKRPNDD